MRWMFVQSTALWTPSDLTSLRAWYDADDSATIFDATTGGSLPSSGNDVARWEDKSGGGYHVTQATAANRPHYVTNTVNGKPVIECTAQWLTASTASDWKFLHDSTGSTVVAVFKVGTTSDPNDVYGLLGTNGTTSTAHGASVFFDDRSSIPRDRVVSHSVSRAVPGEPSSSNVSSDAFCPANTPFIISVVGDPSNGTASARSSMRVDGGTPTENNTFTNTASTSDPTYSVQLGAGGNDALPLTGYIAEVVICNAKLADADREKLEGYLAHKWGLESNLPGTHPYYNAPPLVG